MNTSIDHQNIIASIDIGTTKIGTIVAKVPSAGNYEIIGVGKYPSVGLRKGIIVNLESTISSICESKNIAERMSGVQISKAYVGATGKNIQSISSSAVVAVNNPHRGITKEDVNRVIDVAKQIELPAGQRLIDVLVREYTVNSQTGISDPVGMSGLRLEVNVILVTGATTYIENIFRAVEASNTHVQGLFLDPIASGEAVLTSDEKNSGVALLDIGGGTTDLAIYQDGGPAFTTIIPVGGDHFDSDISYGLNIPVKEAERIKCLVGGVDRQTLNSHDFIQTTKSDDGDSLKIPVKIVAEIILPRMEELLSITKREIVKAGFSDKIPAGMVITGGGSQLKGVVEMGTTMLNLPIRIGRPFDISGLRMDVHSPIFATGVGLIKLAAKDLEFESGRSDSRRIILPSGNVYDFIKVNMKKFWDWYTK